MLKLILGVLWSVLLLIGTFIPEGVLYLIYHYINPQTEMGRILLGGVTIWFGAGISLFFFIFGFMIWISGIVSLLES